MWASRWWSGTALEAHVRDRRRHRDGKRSGPHARHEVRRGSGLRLQPAVAGCGLPRACDGFVKQCVQAACASALALGAVADGGRRLREPQRRHDRLGGRNAVAQDGKLFCCIKADASVEQPRSGTDSVPRGFTAWAVYAGCLDVDHRLAICVDPELHRCNADVRLPAHQHRHRHSNERGAQAGCRVQRLVDQLGNLTAVVAPHHARADRRGEDVTHRLRHVRPVLLFMPATACPPSSFQ